MFVYWEFNYKKPNYQVFTLKPNEMIVDVTLNVQEAFVPTLDFNLKFQDSGNFSIATGSLSTRTIVKPFSSGTVSNDTLGYFNPVKKDEIVIFGLFTEATGPLRTGKGWGIIEYMNISTIRGFRNLER